jgi:hypothetical protein
MFLNLDSGWDLTGIFERNSEKRAIVLNLRINLTSCLSQAPMQAVLHPAQPCPKSRIPNSVDQCPRKLAICSGTITRERKVIVVLEEPNFFLVEGTYENLHNYSNNMR